MATFPSLSAGDAGTEHSEGRVTWVWDGAKWNKQAQPVETNVVTLTDPTTPAGSLYSVSSNKIPVFSDLVSQRDANTWMVDSLEALDDCFDANGKFIGGIPISEAPPTEYEHGTLWFESEEDSLNLFIFYDPAGDKTGGWIPAAPPSTLEGRVSATEAALQQVETHLNTAQANIATLQAQIANLTSLLSAAEARIAQLEAS